ncbi:MAG: sulfurtransferase complex subunit TusD [Pseudomonadota bacterium]
MTPPQVQHRFALMVCHSPDQLLRARAAVSFARAALKAGHQLETIFFYQAAAAIGLATAQISSDDYDPRRAWQELATEHELRLLICVGSAQRRGVVEESLASGFAITGLGQWLAAMASADRVLRFP